MLRCFALTCFNLGAIRTFTIRNYLHQAVGVSSVMFRCKWVCFGDSDLTSCTWSRYIWCFSETIFIGSNIKVGHSPSKKISFIYFKESPLKMMKNAFYFILIALFVLKILKLLSWIFGHVEKRKMRLVSKFMTSQLV